MNVAITDIDDLLAGQEWALRLGQPLESARCLKYLINWMWLSERKGSERTADVAMRVIERTLDVYGRTCAEGSRGEHDLLLLSASVVAGGQELLRRVVETVAYADASKPRVFYSSCCGMLKARLLGDKEMAHKQLALYAASKGKGSPIRVAGRATYEAFIEEDSSKRVSS